MELNELKACPFCGGIAEIEDVSDEDETFYMIQCTNPKCSAGVCFADNSTSQSKIVKAWNKRHNSVTVNQYGKNCTHIKNDGHITITL